MTGTDDIAEKVADLLLDDGARFGQFILKGTGKLAEFAARGSGKLSKTVYETVSRGVNKQGLASREENSEELKLEQLYAYSKRLELETDTLRVADADSPEFKNLLRKEKMVFAEMDKRDDDYSVFVFFSKDSEKVAKAYEGLQARRGRVTEMKPDEFIKVVEPDKLNVLSNVDDVEAEMFRYFAREHGLLFAHIPGKDNDPGQIMYLPKDAGKARQVMLSAGWALTSEDGALIRQQVQHYLKGRSAINISIEDGAKELYIVSSINPGNAVHITEQDYELYKQGAVVKTESRDAPDFYTKCMSACMAIQGAVVLTKDEFESPTLTPETLKELPTIDLFPRDVVEVTEDGYVNVLKDGYDPIQEQDRINSLYARVNQKLGLDDEGNASWGTFNSNVSLSEFSGMEYYADAEEREGREQEFEHFKKAALYNEANFDQQEVDMSDRSVDYVISRAYIRSGTRPEPEQGAHERSNGVNLDR